MVAVVISTLILKDGHLLSLQMQNGPQSVNLKCKCHSSHSKKISAQGTLLLRNGYTAFRLVGWTPSFLEALVPTLLTWGKRTHKFTIPIDECPCPQLDQDVHIFTQEYFEQPLMHPG